ncbi:ribosomal RNA small subunit methyltransferase A [Bacteroidia bacterium]|nr:ribosomal RNA small subunit methyltransferase A [Bacteroidia bacterium]
MFTPVHAKKHLGQHFLIDASIAERIVGSLTMADTAHVLEIGPGTGVLTQLLLQRADLQLLSIEIDPQAADYLQKKFPALGSRLLCADFLKVDLSTVFADKFCVIGNFPYNISSQILFKLLAYKNSVPQIVCMLQKEVAERIAAPAGNKTYGILSVFLQAFYDIEYLFTVHEGAFAPPPHVKSAVIRLRRNATQQLDCDETLFRQVVKTAFNQRRKTLRNSLKPLLGNKKILHPIMDLRPEQLSVKEFVNLCHLV